jgi:hypothetical protein
MTPDRFIKIFLEWIQEKLTGEVIITLNEGGIRGVELRRKIK